MLEKNNAQPPANAADTNTERKTSNALTDAVTVLTDTVITGFRNVIDGKEGGPRPLEAVIASVRTLAVLEELSQKEGWKIDNAINEMTCKVSKMMNIAYDKRASLGSNICDELDTCIRKINVCNIGKDRENIRTIDGRVRHERLLKTGMISPITPRI